MCKADHHDKLRESLTDKQRETLEKFDDCYSELADIEKRAIFVYGFRLGVQIMMEIITVKTM